MKKSIERTFSTVKPLGAVKPYGIKYGPGGRSSNSGITAVVFGSTGFVGRYLMSELGSCGTRVYAPYRGDELEPRHLKPMFDLGQLGLLQFSPRDKDSIRAAMRNADIVINLIGKHYETKHIIPTRKANGKISRVNFDFQEVNVTIPQTLAEIAMEMDVPRFIHVSAVGANLKSASVWNRTKAEGEDAVKKAFPDAVIVKLNTVFGAQDRFLNWIAEGICKRKFYPLIEGGQTLIQPVFVADVARGLHKIVQGYDKYRGKVFHFSGPAEYTHKEVAEFVQDVIMRRADFFDMNLKFARWVGKISEQTIYPWWTQDMALQMMEDVVSPATGEHLNLKDLGVELGHMDRLAFDYLHRFREGGHFRMAKGYH